MSSILECRQVSKRFGKSHAILDATVSFEPGAVHGLLGANGAGKTTLLHILSGMIYPTQGAVTYGGQQVHENALAMSSICLVKADERSWADYKVKDIMKFCSLLMPGWDERKALSLLQRFNLPANKRYKQLSRGMQSQLGIVKGLANQSPITLFDEPTLGLDADMREAFYELIIQECSGSDRTFIISTHLIDESANLFEYIALLEEGVITKHQDTDSFLEHAYYLHGNSAILERFSGDPRVLHAESLAGTTILAWYGDLTKERTGLEQQGISISPLPLQKLFVYLTRKGRSNNKEVI